MGEIKDSVSANSGTFFSLRQPMEFLGHHEYPKWTEDWSVHELDGFFGQGVNNPIAHFLNVDTVEDAIGHPSKSLWGCILRR